MDAHIYTQTCALSMENQHTQKRIHKWGTRMPIILQIWNRRGHPRWLSFYCPIPGGTGKLHTPPLAPTLDLLLPLLIQNCFKCQSTTHLCSGRSTNFRCAPPRPRPIFFIFAQFPAQICKLIGWCLTLFSRRPLWEILDPALLWFSCCSVDTFKWVCYRQTSVHIRVYCF